MNKVQRFFSLILLIATGCGYDLNTYWLSLVDWSEAEISNVRFSYNSFGTRCATCQFNIKPDELEKIVKELGLRKDPVAGSFPLEGGCGTFSLFSKNELTDGRDRGSDIVLPTVLVYLKDVAQTKNVTNRRFRRLYFNPNTNEGCVDLVSPYG
jgi:hypothetical protein